MTSYPFSAENVFEALFEQSPLGIALFDTRLCLLRANPAFVDRVTRCTPLTAGQVSPGCSLAQLAPGSADRLEAALVQVLAGERVSTRSLPAEGGAEMNWEGLFVPVRDSAGRVSAVLAFLTEATEWVESLEQLLENASALRSLVENARRFAIYRLAIDPTQPYGARLLFVSPSICDIVGIEDPNRFDGWFETLHPDDRERVLEANRRALETGGAYNQVTRVFNRRRGGWVWVHTISNPYRGSDGLITHYDGMIIDLTDQVSLQEAERRRAAAEGLRDILRMINSNHPLPEILQAVALQARLLLGASSTMLRQVSEQDNRVRTVASSELPAEFAAIQEQPFYQTQADQSLLSGDPVILEDIATAYRAKLEDPNLTDPLQRAGISVTLRHYHSLLKTPLFVKGQIFGALTFHFAERRTFSEEDLQLASTLADQAALAIENARLIERVKETAVLEERTRLARELHDAVTQTLFSTTLTAEVLPRIWDKDPAEGRRKLEELRELTRGALAEMRTLLLELRPTALEEAPLKDLLRHLSNAFIARARVPVQLVIEGAAGLPLNVKIACYRIAQEALANIAKHAEATQVTIRYEQCPESLILEITDDGQGFEVNRSRPDHFGLGIMRERAEQVGAALSIESTPGQGARVRLDWRPGAAPTAENPA